MNEQQAIEKAHGYFLKEGDDHYGCAETSLLGLQEAFGLPDLLGSSPAYVLNGGFAWEGSLCGSLTGSAVALGMLAGQRIPDRARAKHVSRMIMQGLIQEFRREHHYENCRDLIGRDIHSDEAHQEFMDSGLWRTACLHQIEFVIGKLVTLSDPAVWAQAVQAVDEGRPVFAPPAHHKHHHPVEHPPLRDEDGWEVEKTGEV